jgi:hypothetical protein
VDDGTCHSATKYVAVQWPADQESPALKPAEPTCPRCGGEGEIIRVEFVDQDLNGKNL